MADSETRTYLIWNRDSVTTYITGIDFTNDAGVSHSVSFPGTWESPFAGQTDYTANTTVETQAVTYADDIGDELKQYVSHTGTSLTVNSTASLVVGYSLFGNGYTAGQTIAGFTSSTVITSAAPNGTPLVGENIQFSPPQYLLRVTSNSGVGVGWEANGNGYTGQTSSGLSSTNYIIMSGPPTSTPTPGGTVTFTLNRTVLILAPFSSSTFTAKYSNNTTVLGTYPASFTIRALSTAPIVKQVSNYIGIGSAPYDGGGGGGWDGGGFADGGSSAGPGSGPGSGPSGDSGDGGTGAASSAAGGDAGPGASGTGNGTE
jgi:hypothetical protein